MTPIPTDILERFGNLPDAQHRTGDEFSSACPSCGGARGGKDPSDRFRFWIRQGQASSFWCRRCGFQGFTDDNQRNTAPDPARIAELNELREREQAAEEKRLQAKINELVNQAYWRGFHDGMTHDQRNHWRTAGIPDEFQDYWELGFVENKTVNYQGNLYSSPAMSIPYFENGRKPINVQYRLTNPPQPSDKYRFSYGLRPGLWLADPDEKPNGRCLMLEGMKKTAVSFIELVAKARHELSVVGVPSKTPNLDMVSQLNDCEIVYIALDPDAYQGARGKPSAARRIGAMLGNRARYVNLPAKADDLFNDYGFTAVDFMRYVDAATI